MEPTTFALVALICTRNNLVCRDATEGTKTYETAEMCQDMESRISRSAIPDGYKIASRCVPVAAEEAAGYKREWALSWAGEPAAYSEQIVQKTAVARGNSTGPTTERGGFGSVAQVSSAASGRVQATLNIFASLK